MTPDVPPRLPVHSCGNLTRFDVHLDVRSTRSSFHHYSVGGELTVEESEVLVGARRLGRVPVVRAVGRVEVEELRCHTPCVAFSACRSAVMSA